MICSEKEQFFADMAAQHLALTYDDVRVRTRANLDGPLPEDLDLSSNFSTHVGLKVPLLSAAMTSVTGPEMAIAMGKEGGLGVLHASCTIDEQRKAARTVKLDTHALIRTPVTVSEDSTLYDVLNLGHDFSTFPVEDSEKRFAGLVTQSQFIFNKERMHEPVKNIMVPLNDVLSAPKAVGVDEAYRLMVENGKKMLPIIEAGRVTGMYLFSDIDRIYHEQGQYNVDQLTGQLLVAAAVSTAPDVYERVGAIKKYVDVIVIDTADGDAYHVFEILKRLKEDHKDLDIVVGNVSEGESAFELAEAGADGIKVGQGPGSICSTRPEIGIGMPQVTAVWDCVKALRDKYPHIPVCADGGITEHGDISIGIVAGAHSIMMGKALAGTSESPGPILQRTDGSLYKEYWGMGSKKELRRSAASRARYNSGSKKVPIPEGVEAEVPYLGDLKDVLGLCAAALEKSMRYAKSHNILDHRNKARLIRITSAGLRESHPHDVKVINR